MIRNILFLFFVLYTYPIQAGILKIDELEDCQRISNNVYSFWNNHEDLIKILSEDKKLSKIQKNKLLNKKDDLIVIDFKKNGNNTISIIDNDLEYIKNNESDIKKLLGETEFFNFHYGMVYLQKLAYQLITSK